MSAPLVWHAAAQPTFGGPLLLDTHLWVWMLDPGLGALPPAVAPLIQSAAQSSALYVSDISFWELGQKVAKGKIRLTVPVATWVAKAAVAPGVRYLPVDRDPLLMSTGLTTMHGDPADRILVATAKIQGMPLATADGAIVTWALAEGGTRICDCR